ncbi:polyol/monosaccharide transporter 2 [Perilla frutescens var. hirtella]|uniref:Polyol/monosaccharide transporter 2 n=1 Tax=Perilla frutescens var. hirtella TaxID=608512 RepID=A0AAD4IQQ3_PERFH|nr:polyol/monosaccharide transporter 2 [Perilla frutescens var. hirtella]
MTSILLGYDIGVMSGAILYIQKDLNISDVQKEVIMGILNIYSLLGSAAAGRTSDWPCRCHILHRRAAYGLRSPLTTPSSCYNNVLHFWIGYN